MINRRKFLSHAGAVSLAGIATTLASVSDVQAADYKALVVVFLSGGHDGNNILVPLDAAYNDYAKARPDLALPKDSLVKLSGSHIGHQFGLSPASKALADLFDQKRMAVIANVGALIQPTSMSQYKNNAVNLPPFMGSHTEQEQWIQGWMGDEDTTGWGGRAMDLISADLKNQQPLVAMARDYTALVSNRTNMSQANSRSGSKWGDAELSEIKNVARQRLEWASRIQSNNVYDAEFSRSMRAAYNDTVQFALGQQYGTAPSGLFTSDQIGSDLRYLARHLSYAKQKGARRQIYLVQDGGYDTHADQLSTSTTNPGLEMKISAVANNLSAFDSSIQTYGLNNDVVTVVMSEFGRTLDPAAGFGSDHAWGNHWFAMGGPVKGGSIYGTTFPSLVTGGVDDASLYEPYRGQWIPQFSSDQFIADLLGWLGLTPLQTLTVMPNLTNFPQKTIGFI
jgi:uncharacterized protein (DUF1501 family)